MIFGLLCGVIVEFFWLLVGLDLCVMLLWNLLDGMVYSMIVLSL